MPADITSIPAALRRKSLFLPLRPGTKQPAIPHAVLDAGQPWTEDTDRWLAAAPDQRIGIFMGGIYVVLDADVKYAWEDDGTGTGTMHQVPIHDGKDNLALLLEAAGMTSLPRTVIVRTQGGGTHWYFLQNPECHVRQRTIGFLDIKAAPNGYCAIGAGYELLDDGNGEVAVLPLALARVLASPPSGVLEQSEWNGHREGTYGNAQNAFNNALTAIKGKIVEMGWPEDQANDTVRELNRVSDEPMPDDRLESTVLKLKGWEVKERLTDEALAWAQQQVGIQPDDDQRFLDVNTVKRLWTTDKYREAREAADRVQPTRRPMADVLNDPPPEWVIRGLMTTGVYGLAGPPEAGKSLLVRDWLDTVANGRSWHGYSATAAPVSYVVSEGFFDLADRFRHLNVDNMHVYDEPLMLISPAAVKDFIAEHEGTGTKMIVFDLVYDMGMADDNGTKDVLPIMNGSWDIARQLDCTVVLVGHPGLSGARRFKGSATWRGKFIGEFHMSDDVLTCEKNKYADKSVIGPWSYEIAWPTLRYLTENEMIAQHARRLRVQEVITLSEGQSDWSIAQVLAREFDCSARTVQRMITSERKKLTP